LLSKGSDSLQVITSWDVKLLWTFDGWCTTLCQFDDYLKFEQFSLLASLLWPYLLSSEIWKLATLCFFKWWILIFLIICLISECWCVKMWSCDFWGVSFTDRWSQFSPEVICCRLFACELVLPTLLTPHSH
jgi:hypothetical protein